MEMDYYSQRLLSVSSVRHFAENPARALDDWNGVYPWFNNTDALVYGNFLHSMMEDFVTDGGTASLDGMIAEWDEQGIKLRKKDGTILTKFQDAIHTAHVMMDSEVLQWIHEHMNGKDGWKGMAEEGLHAELDGIQVRGKPDVYVYNEAKKKLIMFDYKTSKPYPHTGKDWGEIMVKNDEDDYYHHERVYGSVVWFTKNLYPWQAGLYREIMRQNGWEDYDIEYRYIIATKEKVPRIDIWQMTDETMDEGLREFRTHLKRANRFVTGEEVPKIILDDSPWSNLQTQKKANILTAEMLPGMETNKGLPWDK